MSKLSKWKPKGIMKQSTVIARKNTECDSTMRKFLCTNGGIILVLSEDALLIKTIRTGVLRALQIKRDCVEVYHEPSEAMSRIRKKVTSKVPVLVLADTVVDGKYTTNLISEVKSESSDTRVIALTYETSKDTIALLFEIGVDYVITKPASVDILIQKMSSVMQPSSKLTLLIQDARSLLEKGEFENALSVCDSIYNIEKYAIALMLRGEVFAKNGDLDKAIDSFERARVSSPQYIEPLKKLAEVNKDVDTEQHLEYLLQLDKLSPLNSDRKCEIGKCYIKKNDLGTGKHYLEQAIKCSHDEYKKKIFAVIYEIAHETVDVSPEISEIYMERYFSLKGLDLSIEDMHAFNCYGLSLRKQGKWKCAVDNYNKALEIAPDNIHLKYNCALALSDGGKYSESVKLIDQVMEQDSEFHKLGALFSYNIASIYHYSKHHEEADRYLRCALSMDPSLEAAKRLHKKMPQSTTRHHSIQISLETQKSSKNRMWSRVADLLGGLTK